MVYYVKMTELKSLGENLHEARKKSFPKDTLADFALRIGVSRATLQKMEQGALSVTLDKYFSAAKVLNLTHTFDALLRAEESLFDD